jgi:2'-5' RNA ligase
MQHIKKRMSLLVAFCIITSIAFSMQPTGGGGGLKTKLTDLRDKLIMLRDKLDGKPAGELPRISLSVAINIGGELKAAIKNIQDALLAGTKVPIQNDPDNQTVEYKFAQYGLTFEPVPLLHLTLTSLELTTIDKINDIKGVLQTIATTLNPLTLDLDTTKKPSFKGRFIACEIIESPALTTFVTTLTKQLKLKKIEFKENLAFKPHISIMGIKPKTDKLLKACSLVNPDFFTQVKTISQTNIQLTRRDQPRLPMPKQPPTLFNLLSDVLNKLTLKPASWQIDSFVAQQYAADLKHVSIATFQL